MQLQPLREAADLPTDLQPRPYTGGGAKSLSQTGTKTFINFKVDSRLLDPKRHHGKKPSEKFSTSSAQKRIEVHKAVTVAWCWRLGNIFQEAGISTSLSRPVVLKTIYLQIQNFESCGYFFEVFGIWSCLVSESSTRSCEPRCLAAHEVMKFTHLKFHRLKFPTPRNISC